MDWDSKLDVLTEYVEMLKERGKIMCIVKSIADYDLLEVADIEKLKLIQ